MALVSHRTAIVAIPPPEAWEPIQRLRRAHDRQVHRWMPHVTLLYPFAPLDEARALVPRLREAARETPRFETTLARFERFTHARGSCTLWLAPEPLDDWRRLQARLASVAPEFNAVGRFPGGFTPHLSVGQSRGEQAATLQAKLQDEWDPLRFTLAEVALIARDESGPFHVLETLPLGP